jgi:hypothetical protein
VNLAMVAAFTAAGLSLVNVVVSARMSSRGHVEQWRRDEERPIVARMLTLSADALTAWDLARQARRHWIDSLNSDPSGGNADTKAQHEAAEHWGTGSQLYDKLCFELAQLDLIAGRPLRDVATSLVREHESVRHWMRPTSGASDWYELVAEQNNKITRLHADLVERTRADLGLDRISTTRRLRSLIPHW